MARTLLANDLSTGITDVATHFFSIPSAVSLTGRAHNIALAITQLADGGRTVGRVFPAYAFAALASGHPMVLAG